MEGNMFNSVVLKAKCYKKKSNLYITYLNFLETKWFYVSIGVKQTYKTLSTYINLSKIFKFK